MVPCSAVGNGRFKAHEKLRKRAQPSALTVITATDTAEAGRGPARPGHTQWRSHWLAAYQRVLPSIYCRSHRKTMPWLSKLQRRQNQSSCWTAVGWECRALINRVTSCLPQTAASPKQTSNEWLLLYRTSLLRDGAWNLKGNFGRYSHENAMMKSLLILWFYIPLIKDSLSSLCPELKDWARTVYIKYSKCILISSTGSTSNILHFTRRQATINWTCHIFSYGSECV